MLPVGCLHHPHRAAQEAVHGGAEPGGQAPVDGGGEDGQGDAAARAALEGAVSRTVKGKGGKGKAGRGAATAGKPPRQGQRGGAKVSMMPCRWRACSSCVELSG
jgi:hypothetical protein